MTDPKPLLDPTKELHAARKSFQRLVEPLRGDLWRHCRWLTGNPWDAEDLVQDTLLRAFAGLSRRHASLPPMRPWLLRIATNRWIDRCRARREQLDPIARETPAPPEVDPVEFGEAAAVLLALPPRERAAVALVDGLGLAAAEAAACLDTSEGSVRAALHRGRARLVAQRQAPAPTPAPLPVDPVDRAAVEAFCRAFNAADLVALRALLLPDARAEVIGLVHEESRDEIMDGSIAHTLHHERSHAEVLELDGEAIAVLTSTDGDGRRRLDEVLRFTTADGRVAAFRYYYFAKEVLREIGARIGIPAADNGYWFH
jgi:RNA polymerase sigma-70 factor (ECF subfamily)